MKWIKRIFFSLIIGVVLLIGIVAVIATQYKSEVIEYVKTEIGKNLTREVAFSKMDYSVFHDFPNISVSIHDIKTHSFKKGDKPFFALKKVDLVFDIWKLITGEFVVGGINLSDGVVNVISNKEGDVNYNVFKPSKDTSSSSNFKIKEVQLTNVELSYTDEKIKDNYVVKLSKFLFTPLALSDSIEFDSELKGVLLKVKKGGDSYLQSSAVIDGDFNFRKNKAKVSYEFEGFVEEEVVVVQGHQFPEDKMQLSFKLTDCNLGQIFPIVAKNLVPENLKSADGLLSATGNVNIGYDAQKPELELSINFSNGDLEVSSEHITGANIEAKYVQKEIRDIQTGELKVSSYFAEHNGLKFSGACTITDFEKLYIEGNIISHFNLNQLHQNYFEKDFTVLKGEAFIDADLKGRLVEIFVYQKFKELTDFKSSGKLDIDNGVVQPKDFDYPIQISRAKLSFTDKDINLGVCEGIVNGSEFSMRGEIENYLNTILKEKPLQVSTDIKMDRFIMEEFISEGSSESNESYHFNLPKSLNLNANLTLGEFSFRKFKASDITGHIKLKDQVLMCKKFDFKTCEGLAQLNASVNSRYKNKLVFKMNSQFENINTNSAFVAFENFGQETLLAKHVQGKVNLKSYFLAETDKALNIDENKIYTETTFEIDDGELIGFEPLLDLEEFLNNDLKLNFDFKHLKFSKLKNTIDINQGVISIPEMSIASNQADINVEGSHTFNQDIDYHLKVKHRDIFKAKKANLIEQEYGVVENKDETGTLPLRMYGNMDDPKFSYDVKSKRDIVAKNLKKEGQAIKKILKEELEGIIKGKKTTTQPVKENKVTPTIIWDEDPDDDEDEEEDEESEMYESDMKYQTSEYIR